MFMAVRHVHVGEVRELCGRCVLTFSLLPYFYLEHSHDRWSHTCHFKNKLKRWRELQKQWSWHHWVDESYLQLYYVRKTPSWWRKGLWWQLGLPDDWTALRQIPERGQCGVGETPRYQKSHPLWPFPSHKEKKNYLSHFSCIFCYLQPKVFLTDKQGSR